MDHLVNHIDKEHTLHKCNFKNDPLFGMKFLNVIDSRFESFLQKCMDNAIIKDARKLHYDLQDIMDNIERNKFIGHLPALLL